MKKADRSTETDPLPSWNSGTSSGAKERIIEFVTAVTQGPDAVAPAERIAVFDNDGTLWSERPVYFQVPFVEERMAAETAGQEETIEEYRTAVAAWLETARHPTKTSYLLKEMLFQPMLELLDYLRSEQFKIFIISGGGIEFVRAFAEDAYKVPPEQVVGSSVKTIYQMDPPAVLRLPDQASLDASEDSGYEETYFVDDRSGKVVGINQHIGRRPLAAFGNSEGDWSMLDWTTDGADPRFGLLIHHNDGVREFDYSDPATEPPEGSIQSNPSGVLSDQAVTDAIAKGWVVVEMTEDWREVYPKDMVAP